MPTFYIPPGRPSGPVRRERISPGWLDRLGITVNRLDEPEKEPDMCETTSGGDWLPGPFEFVGQLFRSAPKQAQKPCPTCHPQAKALSSTQYAQRWLIAIGCIWLLGGGALWLLHALLWTLLALFGVTVATTAVVTANRRRRLRRLVPAQLPPSPIRTAVTSVTVRPIEERASIPAIAPEIHSKQFR
jgi:hypothetical protein